MAWLCFALLCRDVWPRDGSYDELCVKCTIPVRYRERERHRERVRHTET